MTEAGVLDQLRASPNRRSAHPAQDLSNGALTAIEALAVRT